MRIKRGTCLSLTSLIIALLLSACQTDLPTKAMKISPVQWTAAEQKTLDMLEHLGIHEFQAFDLELSPDQPYFCLWLESTQYVNREKIVDLRQIHLDAHQAYETTADKIHKRIELSFQPGLPRDSHFIELTSIVRRTDPLPNGTLKSKNVYRYPYSPSEVQQTIPPVTREFEADEILSYVIYADQHQFNSEQHRTTFDPQSVVGPNLCLILKGAFFDSRMEALNYLRQTYPDGTDTSVFFPAASGAMGSVPPTE